MVAELIQTLGPVHTVFAVFALVVVCSLFFTGLCIALSWVFYYLAKGWYKGKLEVENES